MSSVNAVKVKMVYLHRSGNTLVTADIFEVIIEGRTISVLQL